ncbi:MAG: HTH domain-containing protein, partial [Chloroflexales bacterium]|nr:HTH domain-containing protein [Chloroflexales bacterium]
DQSREQIANDTAVLIARILHGDPYAHRTGNFLVPAWAAAYQGPVRSRGRPAKDRQAQLRTLRRFLSQHVEGQRVERIEHEDLTVALLSRRLGVSERMVQRYLAALEANDEITRSSVPGRRGRLVIDLRPGFAREATLTNTRQTASQTADTVGGWATEVAGDTRAALLDEDSADTRPVTSGEALEGTGAPVDAPDACAAAQASPCAVLPDADGRDQGVAGEAQGHTDSSEARRRRGAQVKQIMDGLMTSLAEMLEREDEETVALRATLLAQFTSVGV